jgi:hypothetical protein
MKERAFARDELYKAIANLEVGMPLSEVVVLLGSTEATYECQSYNLYLFGSTEIQRATTLVLMLDERPDGKFISQIYTPEAALSENYLRYGDCRRLAQANEN